MTRDELIKYLKKIPDNYEIFVYIPEDDNHNAHYSKLSEDDLSLQLIVEKHNSAFALIINKSY